MITAVAGVLGASLLGSVHCAAMCGGFACFAAGGASPVRGEPRSNPLRAHAMYNAGRLTSYLALGALAGTVGAGVTQLGALAGVARAATVLSGMLMVAWGATTLLELRGVRLFGRDARGGAARAPEAWQRFVGQGLLRARAQPVAVRAALTGLFTTLLPCGWLYVFVATAAGSGSPFAGLLVMAVFWIGTLPALLAVGVGAQRAFGPVQRRLPALGALIVLVMGVAALGGRLRLDGGHAHVASSATAHGAHRP